jgi:hypothetical protein
VHNHDGCLPNFQLNGGKELLERTVTEKKNIMARLAEILVLIPVLSAILGGKTTSRAATGNILLLSPPSAMKKPPVPAAKEVE